MIDKSSSTPLYIQIQHAIMDQIRAGELQPGQQVPSEIEIAAQRNVSRMTARKALDTLVTRGVLYRRKGKGTYVTDHVLAYGLSTMSSFSRTMRAQGYTVETRVITKSIVPGTPDILDKLNLPGSSQIIVIRRLRLVEGAPVAIHTSFLDHRAFATLLDVELNVDSLLDTIHSVSGVHMAYSQDSVQAALVTREDAGLLGIELGSPVLKVEGVGFTENGQPLRLTRAVYRGDLFRLTVVNTAEQSIGISFSGPRVGA